MASTIKGNQLPKQSQIQRQSGAIKVNKGGGLHYPKKFPEQNNFSKSQYPKYQKIPDTMRSPYNISTGAFQQRRKDNTVDRNSSLSPGPISKPSKTQMTSMKFYDHGLHTNELINKEKTFIGHHV